MLLHDREMEGIASGETRMAQYDFLGALYRTLVDCEYLVGDAGQRVENTSFPISIRGRGKAKKSFASRPLIRIGISLPTVPD